MKNAKFAGVQRLLSAVFAATVALTSVQIPVYATPQTQAAEQTSQLVNIAGDCEITVPSSQSGYGAERMTDETAAQCGFRTMEHGRVPCP